MASLKKMMLVLLLPFMVSDAVRAMEVEDIEEGRGNLAIDISDAPAKAPFVTQELSPLSVRILRALTWGVIDAPSPEPVPHKEFLLEVDLESGGERLPVPSAVIGKDSVPGSLF